jgi:hypothetical protein
MPFRVRRLLNDTDFIERAGYFAREKALSYIFKDKNNDMSRKD